MLEEKWMCYEGAVLVTDWPEDVGIDKMTRNLVSRTARYD